MLRYRFKEYYDTLPPQQRRDLKFEVMTACNLTSESTFYAWLNIERDDTRDADAMAVIIFCRWFSITPEELLYHPPVMRTPEELAYLATQEGRLTA